jgi:hypothetical protein
MFRRAYMISGRGRSFHRKPALFGPDPKGAGSLAGTLISAWVIYKPNG